jgi:hypothetical protein
MRGTWEGRGTWQTSGPGGGLVLAVIAVVVLIGSGAASAVASAVVTILIIIAVVTGLAAAAVTGALVWRVRSERPGRPNPARSIVQLPPETPPALEESSKQAIEPPRGGAHLHLHLDGADPQVIAAIMRHLKEPGTRREEDR